MNSILIYDGLPIKLETEIYNISENMIFNDVGTLSSFKIGSTTYRYFTKFDFLERDQLNGKYRRGYYIENTFFLYKQGIRSLELLLLDCFSILNFERAEKGDIVTVEKLNPVPPFQDYYVKKKFTFKVNYKPGYDYATEYKTVYDFPPIDTDLESDYYSVEEEEVINLNSGSTGRFYAKNFGDFVVNWSGIPDSQPGDEQIDVEEGIINEVKSKRDYAYLMTAICWKISYIYKDVLSFIAIEPLFYIELLYSHKLIVLNGNPNDVTSENIEFASEYDGLTDVDKIIAELCKQWGRLTQQLPVIEEFDAVFSSVPDFQKMTEYYNSIINFYESLYYLNEDTLFPKNSNVEPIDKEGNVISQEENSNRRIQYLMNLSGVALSTLPFSERKKLLAKYISKDKLEEEEQRIVIRLLNSFKNVNDSNGLLDYMLEIPDLVETNFENLYGKLDDARLERYTIINWFVDQQTNKKYFIYVLYEMWKISKYNLEYIPQEVTPVDGINPNAYFLLTGVNGGDKYMAKYDGNGNLVSGAENLMEFSTLPGIPSTSPLSQHISTRITFKPRKELDKERVIIDRVETNKTQTVSINSMGGGVYFSEHSTPVEYGRYHLYQPISILGYQENLNLTIPNTEPIPSFLFFYAEEFDRIYDLDAALNFGLQVGVEIGMFFLFGGAGALRHLRHLRHISKLKHLRPATNSLGLPTLELVGISADDAVIVWRALDASTETIAVTAAIMTSLFEYQSQTENDPQKAALLKKTSDVFMYMALATGLTSMFARNKATKLADEIIENTTPSILNTLPQDVLGVLQSLRGQKVNAILNFGNTLQSLPLPNNVLHIFYNSLDNLPELKDLFWRDFNKLTKIEDWNFLNNTDILNRWKNMAELDIAERINFDILNSLSKTNAIVRYYSEPALKNILETISFEKRWKFLDNFGSTLQFDNIAFNKLIQNPKGIDLILEWQKVNKIGPDVFSKDDIIDIIKSDLSINHIDLLAIKSKTIASNAISAFKREIQQEVISIDRLNQIQNGNAFTSLSNLNPNGGLKEFQVSNKLLTKTKIFNDNILISTKDEKFISGNELAVKNDIFNGSIPSEIKEPNYSKFDFFKKKAYDLNKKRYRMHDTELKYIFNLLEEHWSLGNRFDIEIESTYYICESCQGYLVYLKELAKNHNKVLNIKVIADPNIMGSTELKIRLN